MSVLIGITTKYMCANFLGFGIHIFSDMPDYIHSGPPFF